MRGLREVDRWFIDQVAPHERRYLAMARRFSVRNGIKGDEAADLVHDVYARLLSSEGWRFIDDPRAYVLTMIRNLGIQKLRRARIVTMENIANIETSRLASEDPDPFEQASGRLALRRALEALAALPPHCREVVTLRRLHDLSAREIAARLGLSLSTVEKRLARGMVLMAQILTLAEAAPNPEATGNPESVVAPRRIGRS